MAENKSYNILIACTGSVAAIKLSLLTESLLLNNKIAQIRVIVTNHAKHFYNTEDIPKNVEVYCDEDEWKTWNKRGDPVLHIELAKWADMLVIAPLDANTLAKIANGLCDNILTCVVRAWDIKKPLLFCPAMNTKMWDHPITSQHISILESWGYTLVPCIAKTLMCGDTGIGAMAEVQTITQRVLDKLKSL